MKGLVYSYLRFSTLAQREGTSSERQTTAAREWAERHGLVLDEKLSMRDEGLSAFHGKHVTHGAFGAFLQAIQQGRVPRGSTLVVEALDRLSRAKPTEALSQFTAIINAGVTIVTLLDGKVYSTESIEAQPLDLLSSILLMMRANEESTTKSKRVRESTDKLCQRWLAGTWRGRLRGKDPSWIRWSGGKSELIPERAEAVRLMIDLHLKGNGSTSIARTMRERGVSAVAGEMTEQNVMRFVKHRALIGELHVEGFVDKAVEGGVRKQAFEYVLPDYYPPVISRELWDELRAASGQRGRRSGKAAIPGVLAGLGIMSCGYCGRAMVAQNAHLGGASYKRRFRCGGFVATGCAIPGSGSCSAVAVERALFAYCSEIANLRSLFSDDRMAAPRATLAKTQAKLAKVDQQLERFADAFFNDDAPDAFKRRAAMLESERVKLAQELAQAEHELAEASRSDVVTAHAKWRGLMKGVLGLDADARNQARQLVADTFGSIRVWYYGVDPGDNRDGHIDLALQAKGGPVRTMRIDRKGNLIGEGDAEATQAA